MISRHLTLPPGHTELRPHAASPSAIFATFRCHPTADAWETPNSTGQWPLIVFPHLPVLIQHHGQPPVLADPVAIMFYNPQSRYTRNRRSKRGDACDVLCIHPSIARDIAGHTHPDTDPHRPFPRPHARSDHRTNLAIRQALATARNQGKLALDEAAIRIARLAIAKLPGERPRANHPNRRSATTRRHAHLTADARALLANHYREDLSLADIAEALDTSEFHLQRVFKSHTGSTLHNHRLHLRLNQALIELLESRAPIASIAHGLGFSSQAHLTSAFKNAFNTTPAQCRREARPTTDTRSKKTKRAGS